MRFQYTHSLCTGEHWNASGRWSYTSGTHWKVKIWFDKFKQILWIVEPLFLDDELAKASLVGPAVVGRDGRVAGTLFYIHIVQKSKFK